MAALLLLLCFAPSFLPVWTVLPIQPAQPNQVAQATQTAQTENNVLPQSTTILTPSQSQGHSPHSSTRRTAQTSTPRLSPPSVPQNFPTSGGQLAHYSAQDEGIAPYVENPLSSFTLPYAEGSSATLPDKIRQADTALLQTVARLQQSIGLGDLDIRIQFTETRIRLNTGQKGSLMEQLEAYPFLQAILTLPQNTQPLPNNALPVSTRLAPALVRDVLEESLLLWAPSTSLIQENSPFGPFFFLLTDNTITHCILLSERIFPVVPTNTPAIALIIDDAGHDLTLLRQVLALPYPLTVSVLPETAFAEKTALLAKALGQEVFLHQPMEARPDYTATSPNTLLKGMEAQAMLPLLWQNLAAVPGAVGLNNHTGSAFTADAPSVQNFLDALNTVSILLKKSFFLVDSVTGPDTLLATIGTEQGFSVYKRTFFIDEQAQVESILAELAKAEKKVDNGEYVLLIGHLRPATVKALKQWVPHVPVVFISALPPFSLPEETP